MYTVIMSRADDIANDLGNVLCEFSTSEKKLHERIRASVERGKFVALTVDTWEALPFPTVRHIFYGLNERQARTFYEEHKKGDKQLRNCEKGAHGEIKCRTSQVRTKQVSLAEVMSGAAPARKQKGTLGQMARGTK
jgi:hypothetical protein